MSGSSSRISPARFPATKQVLVWTTAGRSIRRANARMFRVPCTFVEIEASSGGLNDTRPEQLRIRSMSAAISPALSSEYPRFSRVMSPPSTSIFSSTNSRRRSPRRFLSTPNAGEWSRMSSNRVRLSDSFGARTMR